MTMRCIEVSVDVWLNKIVPYCSFSSLISLTQANTFFLKLLSGDRSLPYWTQLCKSHYQRQFALAFSQDGPFQENIWLEDDSGLDTDLDRRFTLNELIRLATDQDYKPFLLSTYNQSPIQRNTLTSILLSCYPACHLSPLLFFLKMVERFYPEWSQHEVNTAELSAIRIHTANIIKRWVAQSMVADFRNYYPDDYQYLLIEIVQPFLYTWRIWNESMKSIHNSLVEQWAKLHQFESKNKNQVAQSDDINTSLLNCSVEEIAKILTIRGALNKSRLAPTEFVNQNWNKSKNRRLAPNIMTFIHDCNRTSQWVTFSILSFDDKIQRSKCLEKMINLALTLGAQQDHNSCMGILAGIANSAVHRLIHTWAELSTSTRQKYDKLQLDMVSDKSYQTLRHLSSNSSLPYLGITLTDLTFIEDGSQATDPKYINLRKLFILHSVISGYMDRDEHPVLSECNSDELSRCVHLFEKSVYKRYGLQHDEEIAYTRSLQLEPRARRDCTTVVTTE